MSEILVTTFRSELDRIKAMSGSLNEQTIRPAFRAMLRNWARAQDLFLLEEHPFLTKLGTKKYPDGTIVHDLRVPLGYWEAKDTQDDLDEEIAKKTAIGYPTSNIIYETSELAVLIQNGTEIHRTDMSDITGLTKLLTQFFAYERPEIRDFRRAIAQFQIDLPEVLKALRSKITDAYKNNKDFSKAAKTFLSHAKETINPTIGEADVREMLIQHILTEDIFNHVFNESDFHRDNNVARQLYDLERLFFRGAVKKNTLKALEPYYAAIRTAAAEITAHSEKQTFLKVIYESFYKTYNPKAADRLGVVYTPAEIVRFMIEGTDWLCREHFGKGLIEPNVEILDPCTGTGTYICELLEMFRGDRERLAYKYKNELHANELAILPYYVANLNIEATYAQIAGQYAEYPSLCFVDTLDNVEALGRYSGFQPDLLGALSDENIERVKRQNDKKISVIIGNPPYNANQQNENDNNKNRDYNHIDASIKNTYVKKSTAQKTKVYDMYSRFYRWASDRLEDNGIVAYVTNRSFIDSRTFDGFRAIVADEYSHIYIMDLGGDVRANPKLSGTTHNVFGIQTGVAIAFLVKTGRKKGKVIKPAKIRYARRPEMERADDKLSFLGSSKLETLEMKTIIPSKRGNWVNQVENEWDDLIPIASKAEKKGTKGSRDRAIFELFSLGVVTARDEWVIDYDLPQLREKVTFHINEFNNYIEKKNNLNSDFDEMSNIKWTRSLKSRFKNSSKIAIRDKSFLTCDYRPFIKKYQYFGNDLNEMIYQTEKFIGLKTTTPYIGFLSGKRLDFKVFSGRDIPNYALLSLDPMQNVPRYRYTEDGTRIDNITDWALRKFRERYDKKLTKDDIFNYCYGVLHDPIYRETYAINLKREFPRIPFYPDFKQWAKWGKKLMQMHIGYEDVKPLPLSRVDMDGKRAEGSAPKPVLKSIPEDGHIKLDADTTLTGIPTEAWEYRLGNRSALDWVLDQHKEKKPRDPTIREKFNTYRFADYKDHVIDLLGRVARVSVDTVAITKAMAKLDRSDWD